MASQVAGITPPTPDIIASDGGVYWTRADLRIVLDVTDGTIAVEDASGPADAAKTARLHAFILDTAFNAANSKFPGTRPIFYTDVPITSGAPNNCNCTNAAANGCKNAIAAFVAGVDDTNPAAGYSGYNGGLENYPRFHEEWGGVDFTYLGSFVSLGTPQRVNGPWCGTGMPCNAYNAPNRNWNFDADFNSVANLPPLTPRFVYVQQILFTEEFR